MPKVLPYTKNRQAIYDLLTRAKRFHSTMSMTLDLEVGPLMDAIARARAAGRPVGFIPALVKATSLVMVKYPRLNQHLFHGPLRRYCVDFEEVSANIVIMRKNDDGERILLPYVIRNSDQKSVDEITLELLEMQSTPLKDLPSYQQTEKVKRLPGLALRAFSYLARADHRFYSKYFGTYGFSPLLHEDERGVKEDQGGVSGHSIANTGTVFFPFGVTDKPLVKDGEIEIRKVLSIIVGIDHFLVDGYECILAGIELRRLLNTPSLLGL